MTKIPAPLASTLPPGKETNPIYLLIVLLELAENHEHTDKKFGKIRQELIDYFQFWSYPKIHLLLSVDYKFVLFVMGNVY